MPQNCTFHNPEDYDAAHEAREKDGHQHGEQGNLINMDGINIKRTGNTDLWRVDRVDTIHQDI